MSTLSMPGFTAEHSLYRTEGHFHTGVSDTFRVFDAEVIAQMVCADVGGGFVCGGDEPGGGDSEGPDLGGPDRDSREDRRRSAQCRARCLVTKRGAAQEACLDHC
jgi:hypothetical protein